MKPKIYEQILYRNEDVILMVFITTVHQRDLIDIALDEFFDAEETEWKLYKSYGVYNRLYLMYISI